VLAAMRHGADDYLIKTSFSKDELSQKLSRLLAGKATKVEASQPDLTLDVSEHFAAERPLPELVAVPQLAKPRRPPISGEEAEARLQEMIDAWE
jgi:DNA-binding NarL/FixJ family response regulator